MASSLARLLSPFPLPHSATSGLTLRNRVTMSALTRDRSVPTNVPNEVNRLYYAQRSAGGAGLIVTEGTLIVQQGTEWQHAPGIWSAEQVAAWKKITDTVHANGSLIFCQLWHLGRVSHPDAPEQIKAGTPVYAPSAIAARGGKFRFLPGTPGYVTPTAIDDPKKIVAQFRQAAVNAKEAGFDGVELHGANGYIVHQFLDSTSNLRTDAYGGSVENRARFGLEVLKELVDVWGPGKVGVKLSPAGGYNDMGMPLDDTLATYTYFITQADALPLAYFSLVRYVPKLDAVIDGKPRATQHDVLAAYRPHIRNAALFLNADLTPDEASKLIEEGKIDAGVFGWLWIGHPDLTARLQSGGAAALGNDVDVMRLYGGSGPEGETAEEALERVKKGYTDYPFQEGSAVEVKL